MMDISRDGCHEMAGREIVAYRRLLNALFLSVLLGMVMLSSVSVQGQTYQELEDLVKKTEHIMNPKISDNGKWAAWYSSKNDLQETTVMISSTDVDKKQWGRQNVSKWVFGKDKISLLGDNRLEVLDLMKGKSIYFDHVKSMDYLEGEGLWIVHYQAGENGRLEIYNDQLKLQAQVDQVSFFSKKGKDLFVIKKTDTLSELYVLKHKGFHKLRSTPHPIQDVWLSGLASGGHLVAELHKDGIAAVYISEDHQVVLMDDDLKGFQSFTPEFSQDDENVFLVFSKVVYPQKENVQLWYGTEKQLGKYTRGYVEKYKLIWDPVGQCKTVVSNSSYSSETPIGKKGFFLKLLDDQQMSDKADRQSGRGYDQLVLWDRKKDHHSLLMRFQGKMVIHPKGTSVLALSDKGWMLYDFLSGMCRDTQMPSHAVPYYTSDHQVLWISGGKLILENLLDLRQSTLADFGNFDVQAVNADVRQTPFGYGKHFGSVNLDQLLVVKVSDPEKEKFTYASIDKKGKVDLIVPETSDYQSEFRKAGNANAYVWITENYNKAPVIMAKRNRKAGKEIYQSNKGLKGAAAFKRIVVRYKGADGANLSGALFLPENGGNSLRYPVVTHIYESQHHLTNRYFKASFLNGLGINEALLLHSGVGVFLPDISYSEKGPALSALESVHNALDQLVNIKQVDRTKLGLVGQSFGGYETSFIAGNSERFAAYIAGAAVTDPIRMFYSFNKGFDAPEYWRVEGRQYEFKVPLADDAEKYIKNSPIMFAQNVSSPILLWAGSGDTNVDFEHTRSLFIALRKYRKPVVALIYKEEQHALIQPHNQKDLSLKMLDWWNYHLKDEKNIVWIEKQMKGM